MFDFSYSNILNSNLVNFVLMVLILYKFLRKPMADSLKSKADNTAEKISSSKEKRLNAQNTLTLKEKELKAVPDKIRQMEAEAKNTLKSLKEKNKKQFEEFTEIKTKAARKRIENEENDIIKETVREFVVMSADKAQEEIIGQLEENPGLHDKIFEKIIGEI